MVRCYLCCPYLLRYSILLVLQVCMVAVQAQQQPVGDRIKKPAQTDTLTTLKDTAVAGVRKFIKAQNESVHGQFSLFKRDTLPTVKRDSIKALLAAKGQQAVTSLKQSAKKAITIDINDPFKNMFVTRPVLKLNGGMVCYNGNYRSIIDTPYAEKDILQHNVTGRWDVTVAGLFPIQVNYWLRQSNSSFFRNIYDVQAVFNGAAFQNKLRTSIRERLLALAPSMKDSLLQKTIALKQFELSGLGDKLRSTFSEQKRIEANEILKVPKFTWDASLPDSINLKQADSLKQVAGEYLQQYATTKKRYDSLKLQADSLKDTYERSLQKIKQYQQLVNGNWNDLQSARAWKSKLNEYGLDDNAIPVKYRWLLGLRNFSLGRSPVNYSELTAKNVSVNGINFEYNSWYYLAFTAGTVNYQFRDFVVHNGNKLSQYLVMARAGIGRLDKDYFILSAFKGQKQLFASSSARSATLPVTGFSAESRWAINRNTWVTAEVGKSITPDFRNNPPGEGNKFTLRDNSNQALAFKLYSNIPVTQSRIEAFYKKTGANYQSFSSYTNNAAMESWYIKADQNLFKRQLRIAASLRKNEFVNPFIVQDYKSNTLFKSLTATVRVRKWPVVTIGYQPMSQYTKVDEQVIENRFQTLNTTLYHFYPVRQLKMATTIILNKFYNSSSDTGFLYYNAINSYLAQTFYFKSFTAQAGISYTKNGNYTLQVLDGSIQPNIPNFGTLGFGVKINNFNHSELKAGGYVSANIRIMKNDMLFLSYEHGYLPGNRNSLVRNEMGTIQFVKTFNFK